MKLKQFIAGLISGVMMLGCVGMMPKKTGIKANAAGSVEAAISWALATAADNSHGYSQATRWGPDYDCSSFVISAFKAGGYDTGGATYTGNMRANFTANGFTWIPWSSIGGVDNLKRGDILLNEVNHTELYLGNSRNVGAHWDYDGVQGDSSGREINEDSYWYDDWDGVLRANDLPTNKQPIGWLDKVEGGDGKIYVKGWTFDPDEPTKQLMVHIYVGGTPGSDANSYAILADAKRQDVDDAYHCGAYHGFEGTIYVSDSGEQNIYAYALDTQGGANPELSGCPLKATINGDTENPAVNNIQISDISSTGYTVTCDVSDNVGIKEVSFPTWTTADGQDDLIWHKGTVKDGKVTFRLDTKDHHKQTGVYRTHIYAYDYAGNSQCEIAEDVTVPNPITNIQVKDVDKTGYTVNCDIDKDWGAIKIQFPTWTDKDAQDDLIWHDGTIVDGTSAFRVNAVEHNNEGGIYITHIYVFDDEGNPCSVAVPGVSVCLKGDLSLDDKLIVLDLIVLQRYLLAKDQFNTEQFSIGDMNNDGNVDVFDLALLKRVLLTDADFPVK